MHSARTHSSVCIHSCDQNYKQIYKKAAAAAPMMHASLSTSSGDGGGGESALLKAKQQKDKAEEVVVVEVGSDGTSGKVDALEEVLPNSNNGGAAAEEQCRKSEEALKEEEEEEEGEGEGGGNNNGGLHSNKGRVLERKEEEEESHHHHHQSSKSNSCSSGGNNGNGGNANANANANANGGDGDGDGDGNGQKRLVHYLYLSYLLCRWGDRMWEFAVGLFMIHIWKHSLLLASLYGLVEMTAIVFFGVTIGDWMDRFPRLKVIQTSLALQNISIFGASIAILVLLVHPWPTVNKSFKLFAGLILTVNVLGGVSALASLATKVSLERDWVVVMAEECPANNLTRMNATMRRIDLSCTLLAAVFVGLLMSAVSVVTSAIFMAGWNVTCVGLEYWLLLTVYRRTPRLHERRPGFHLQTKNTKMEMLPAITKIQDPGALQLDIETPSTHGASSSPSCNIIGCQKFRRTGLPVFAAALWRRLMPTSLLEGWKVYMRQQDMLAGISYSILSFTVLSFGTLMTASLTWRGCPAYVLGLSRGIAALVGIFGTISYPFLQARLQTLNAGLVSILLQWTVVTLCVISVWVKNSVTSTALLISGAGAARAGLYMFELSVTQLMQESVPEEERGVVVGVQNTMQSFCYLLIFIVAMIIPHPQDFDKLIIMSFGSVTLAAILYAFHVYSSPMKKNIIQSRY